jgi:hypothetical protein
MPRSGRRPRTLVVTSPFGHLTIQMGVSEDGGEFCVCGPGCPGCVIKYPCYGGMVVLYWLN